MKRSFQITLFVLPTILAIFTSSAIAEKSANYCIDVKEEWGKACGPESFKAIMKNTCGRDVKVSACVERKAGDGKPACGSAIISPNKVNNGFYVCKGTGRYSLDASYVN